MTGDLTGFVHMFSPRLRKHDAGHVGWAYRSIDGACVEQIFCGCLDLEGALVPVGIRCVDREAAIVIVAAPPRRTTLAEGDLRAMHAAACAALSFMV